MPGRQSDLNESRREQRLLLAATATPAPLSAPPLRRRKRPNSPSRFRRLSSAPPKVPARRSPAQSVQPGPDFPAALVAAASGQKPFPGDRGKVEAAFAAVVSFVVSNAQIDAAGLPGGPEAHPAEQEAGLWEGLLRQRLSPRGQCYKRGHRASSSGLVSVRL